MSFPIAIINRPIKRFIDRKITKEVRIFIFYITVQYLLLKTKLTLTTPIFHRAKQKFILKMLNMAVGMVGLNSLKIREEWPTYCKSQEACTVSHKAS